MTAVHACKNDGCGYIARAHSEGLTFYLAHAGMWSGDLQTALAFLSVNDAQAAVRSSGLPVESQELVDYVPVFRGWVIAT